MTDPFVSLSIQY